MPASLDIQYLLGFPEDIDGHIFNGGIATTVKNEVRGLSQQARCISPEFKGAVALAGFAVMPEVFHFPYLLFSACIGLVDGQLHRSFPDVPV